MKDWSYGSIDSQLVAEIYYLSTQEGGRTTPVLTGYRGQFYYDGHNWDASQEFLGQDGCEAGETVVVKLFTLSQCFHMGKFFVGKKFEIREGAVIVGKGEVTQIISQKYKYWDYDTFFKHLSERCLPYDKKSIQEVTQQMIEILTNDKSIINKRLRKGGKKIGQSSSIKVVQNLANKKQMIQIELKVDKENFSISDVCDRWLSYFPHSFNLPTSLVKLQISSMENTIYELQFAIAHKHYLTGSVLFKSID